MGSYNSDEVLAISDGLPAIATSLYNNISANKVLISIAYMR